MERKKIEERLLSKEQEIASLEEKIKAARVYIQALRDVLTLPAVEDGDGSSGTALRSGSAVAEARQVILDRRTPLHVNEILDALGKGATRQAKASLTSSIAAYVRRGEIFTRTAPNTFGLFELGHETADSDDVREPPADFGPP